jgi:hypothetical protein
VWDAFVSKSVHRRRGQLYLTAAGPGGYKSVLALNEALKMGVPTLYVAMDSDANSTAIRSVQAIELVDQDSAEAGVLNQERWAMDALAAVPYLSFTFPASPTIEELIHHVFAYAEAQGDFPHWIVIDNLMDVSYTEDENRGLNRIMEDLAQLAKQTKAGVHVLAHVTGEYEVGDLVVPMSGLRHKVSKKPVQVLTLCRGALEGQLWVSVVKNRTGPVDPTGLRVRAELTVDGGTMQIFDPRKS